MKRDFIYIIIITITIACAFNKPERNYNTDLWDLEFETGCIYRLDSNDDVIQLCIGDEDFPNDIIAIELWQWIRERKFADDIIRQCKEWR